MSDVNLAKNLYGLLDNELDRMHKLLKFTIELERSSKDNNSDFVPYYATSSSSYKSFSTTLMERISVFQDLMFKAVVTHDSAIQEKVAELALMGSTTKGEKSE